MRTHTPPDDRLPAAFRVGEGLAAGVGRKRLRHTSLERPFRGVRVRPAEPVEWDDETPEAVRHTAAIRERMNHYAPVMPQEAFFAGVTAAVLHEIPLPPWAVAPVDTRIPDLVVAVWEPRTPPRRPGVRGLRVRRELAAVTTVAGLRVATLADTWAMLGATLGEDDLVVAADHLLRVPRHPGGFRPPERGPYATREQLAAAIGRRKGAAALRRALERARTGSSSPRETRLRLLLIDAGLPEPVLDLDVYGRQGHWIAAVDMAYPTLKIAIEYDGEGHRSRAQFERDVDRLADLEAAGWIVLRFTARHLRRHRDVVAARVRDAIRRRTSVPSGPSIR
ncbi:DUF559 domain-containing protein [Microbacterium paludicola]|uniref:DUF559 domain-containing protein n=1 Tax=Microbacterium paludicola TaxID=300019 RepID=A0A4Y9FQT4_9MICO|nr:DUF559 domain-containing protein [Microbacterium paludicola]MBF0817599.1 DUF559 domain-containing protein [Microbacterium paludicola]TFU30649.1 DUF559 domain-containing protein [Microbacterium paludicola]